jgi:hypothetical protein
MSMRTQIYLSEAQRKRLDVLAAQRGTSLAQVIRDAVDAYIAASAPGAEPGPDETFGSLPDLMVPDRSEWDRA